MQHLKIDNLKQIVFASLGSLASILNRDGFIIFISGAKEKGKTDFALFLAECCFLLGFRKHIATNIKTDSYMVEAQITNLPDLRKWLRSSGRKLFILDEAGKHLPKMRFMTEKNIEIMELIQLIRHYDCGLIGIAPSDKFIDSNFLNTDIIDARIKKILKHKAIVKDYLHNETYFLLGIEKTSIKFNSKDIAEFSIHKKTPLDELPKCCAVARIYAQTGSYKAVSKAFNNMNNKEIRRYLRKHLKHSELPITSHQEG